MMKKWLKHGILKLRQVKLRISLPLSAIIIILYLFPFFACTRTVTKPAELTAIAERIADKYPSFTPTATKTPVQPTSTPNPSTATPIPTDTPIVRNTFPVELIDDNSDIYANAIPTEYTLFEAAPTAEPVILPELSSGYSEKSIYLTQNGDMLNAIAYRYGTTVDRISGAALFDDQQFLPLNTSLLVTSPKRSFSNGTKILPDEYVVMSYPSTDYDLENAIREAGGYLSSYKESVSDIGIVSGMQVIQKVSQDYSISPILLLSILEFRSGWVYGTPVTQEQKDYPLGMINELHKGLYRQMTWAAGMISSGYYGWRYGTISRIAFGKDPQPPELVYYNPVLNAGSVAIQFLFAQFYPYDRFESYIYGDGGFIDQFLISFGNVWEGFDETRHGINNELKQPEMTLPFYNFDPWNYTGGPHAAWSTGSPLSALDFAPQMAETGCAQSDSWITAPAGGVIIRSNGGSVLLDLDMDGNEETGWVILFLHVATRDRVPVGKIIPIRGRIGHPSCEGGKATGTHLHIARKYNGEWIAADGPVPFVLSGWTAVNGNEEYEGSLVRGDEKITAKRYASKESLVNY